MAFASTITRKKNYGSQSVHYGTFTNASGDTGGNINTGLHKCEWITLQHTGSSVVASAPAVNETMPCDGSAVTVVTVDNADGIWVAGGH